MMHNMLSWTYSTQLDFTYYYLLYRTMIIQEHTIDKFNISRDQNRLLSNHFSMQEIYLSDAYFLMWIFWYVLWFKIHYLMINLSGYGFWMRSSCPCKAFTTWLCIWDQVFQVQIGALFTPIIVHVYHLLLFKMCVQSHCKRHNFAY